MRLVIIGGDAAGMSAASRAGRLKPETEIIVFEQSHDVSYSACGMPYNIADSDRPIDDLVVRKAEVFKTKQGIDLRLGHKVTAIDRDKHLITGTTDKGEPFECSYDKLLIATGASAVLPDIPGIEDEKIVPLKNLNDGRILKQYLHNTSVSKAVIIGMGYIALEMAESLRRRGIDVVMIKPRKRFLPWMTEELAQVVYSEVEKNNVELYPGHSIESIEKDKSGFIVKGENISINCQMVLPATGVKPNSELAVKAGLETGPKDEICVDHYTCTSDPDIYAAGDCADAFNVVTGQKDWIPLALQANRAGRTAADNICGESLKLQGIAGSAVFKVFDLEVARAGLNIQEAREKGFDPVEVVVKSRSRAHAHPGNKTIHVAMVGDKKSGRLLGTQMVGEEGAAHRIHSVAVALACGMKVDEFWQTDMPYAPPFGPVWDPLLTAANQLMKKI